jgi:acyl-CoA reductase-like NAD-dependent aldehyde dehydrogenase
MSPTIETRLFIAGKFQDAASGETFALKNPATGEHVATLQAAGKEDIDRAVAAAKAAQPAWAAASTSVRAAAFMKLADLIEQPEHAEELKRVRLPLSSRCIHKCSLCSCSLIPLPWFAYRV